MKEKAIAKFWDNIHKDKSWKGDGCWQWTGPLDKSGLPVIRLSNGIKNGKVSVIEFSPRRLSCQLAEQYPDSSERVQPLHCKNKLCVNPSHLVFGDEGRFWAKVDKSQGDDGCWPWLGSWDRDCYGKFRISENGKKIDIRAHVYSWQLHTGRPVISIMVVMHKCDHPYCVNPTHLSLGTTQDNTKDRDEKDRQAKGEKFPHSKLTKTKVEEIRELRKNGASITQLSSQFEVAYNTIACAINGKTWKHVL